MSCTLFTCIGSPLWLAHSIATFDLVKLNRRGPPPRTKGSACSGFRVERVKLIQCGSPAEATTLPCVSHTATAPRCMLSRVPPRYSSRRGTIPAMDGDYPCRLLDATGP